MAPETAETRPAPRRADTAPGRGLAWPGVVAILMGLAAIDLSPLLLASHKEKLPRELAGRGITLGEFRKELEAGGIQVEEISNLNALLLRYPVREPLLVRFPGKVLPNRGVPDESSGMKSRIIFLDSLDDATTVPVSQL